VLAVLVLVVYVQRLESCEREGKNLVNCGDIGCIADETWTSFKTRIRT
jgi:hypothetical protein